jgi:hypothetical protein
MLELLQDAEGVRDLCQMDSRISPLVSASKAMTDSGQIAG